jgi:hypothetical protein
LFERGIKNQNFCSQYQEDTEEHATLGNGKTRRR